MRLIRLSHRRLGAQWSAIRGAWSRSRKVVTRGASLYTCNQISEGVRRHRARPHPDAGPMMTHFNFEARLKSPRDPPSHCSDRDTSSFVRVPESSAPGEGSCSAQGRRSALIDRRHLTSFQKWSRGNRLALASKRTTKRQGRDPRSGASATRKKIPLSRVFTQRQEAEKGAS